MTASTRASARPRPTPRRLRARSLAAAAALLVAGPLLAGIAPAHAGTARGAATAAPSIDQPVLVTAPRILGSVRVGETVTTDRGTWNPSYAATAVQWLRDGVPVLGATGTSYLVTADDYLKRLSVRVAAAVPGSAATIADSAATTVGLGDAPVPTRRPAITGQPKVGTQLTADPGLWAPANSTFRYQWFRDNTAIPDATTLTYTPTIDDLNRPLTVRVEATSTSLTGWTVVYSAPVTVLPGAGLSATTAPRIRGVAEVGETLTADDGVWAPVGATLTRQWLRDGVAIAGATGPTLVLTAADLGRAITLRVTAKLTGYADATATTTPLTVAARSAVASVTAPHLSGKPMVGKSLWVTAGSWQPSNVEVTYQWLRDGAPIPGATDAGYALRKADAGHQVSARVTAAQAGRAPASVATPPVAVTKAPSTLRIKRVQKVVREGQGTVVVVKLEVPRQASTAGTIRIFDGVRRIARLRMPNVGRSVKLTVPTKTLRGLGKHRLSIVYSGNGATEASDTAVTVRVQRTR
ncbi:hypothetical protein [Nocardioides daejeonensis]|uniref:hypothetical protein n=1 Tax=Nocardioides daejeonensis TaxID=1046556 RepID=UPI0013A56071|nr:hypothetical protein [Nocardioides daejeonensis]